MRKSIWITSAAVAALGIGSIAAVGGADVPKPAGGAAASAEWPKWLGPDANGISREPISDKWPADGPKKLWSATVGKGYSSAVAQAGRVYLQSGDEGTEVLTCFEADTGKQLWREESKGGYPKNDYPGARGSPTIDGDKIYTYGGGGQLACRDLQTGKSVWTLDVLKATGSQLLTWGQASSPLVSGDAVVVQSGEGGPIVVAADKNTGKVVWQSEAKGVGGYAAVVPADVGGKAQLIAFAGAGLFGMDPQTGKTLWQQPWKAEYDVTAGTPVYDGKGNLFVSSGYGSGKGAMFQLAPAGAKKVWEKREFRVRFPASILDGNTLYMVTDEGRGPVKAMEWPTGKVLWELKDAKMGYGGSILKVGDKLIAQSDNGEIHLIQATPQAGKILSTFKPFESSSKSKIWSMPVVYKGKMYAKGLEELVCFDVK